MRIKFSILLLLFLLSFNALGQNQSNQVFVSGALSNVMKNGDLQSTILLDTISTKENLYGLGPKHYLTGELLIMDGEAYVTSIDDNGAIKMEKTFQAKAPFFVYTYVEEWESYRLPKDITSFQELEKYLLQKSKEYNTPFAFKLQGVFNKVEFHIQNLPNGTLVKSHKDAHQGQKKYVRKNINGDLIGFFSTQHQQVFTHHNQFIHIHFINQEKTEMGHVDDFLFSEADNILLFLPKLNKVLNTDLKN